MNKSHFSIIGFYIDLNKKYQYVELYKYLNRHINKGFLSIRFTQK